MWIISARLAATALLAAVTALTPTSPPQPSLDRTAVALVPATATAAAGVATTRAVAVDDRGRPDELVVRPVGWTGACAAESER